jgi:hypothetical protein
MFAEEVPLGYSAKHLFLQISLQLWIGKVRLGQESWRHIRGSIWAWPILG